MSDFSSLSSIRKLPASTLSHLPQSDFPGMIKVAESDNPPTPTRYKIKPANERNNLASLAPEKNTLLPISIAAVAGLIIGKNIGQITEKPIDNLPAGIIGATIGVAALLGTAGFYVAKYGGFFDKDRDYRTIFKNL